MTIIRDTFPIRDREATPTKPPTRDDGVHGERSDQTADGPEPVAAEHTDALALANTSQKAPPDHREDLVQGDVQSERQSQVDVHVSGERRHSK